MGLDAPTAALYIANSASFVVGPLLNPEVARLCNRRKVAYIPGCGSVTEISEAEELGVEICKIFPGEAVGGPAFVKNVLGPMPWVRLMPTGVNATQEKVSDWVKAGVAAMGVTHSLIRPEWVDSGNYAAITARTAEILAWIKAAQSAG